MKYYEIASFILIFALAAGAVNAATTSSTLQVLGYSTTPSKVYPGTNGQLQLTLSNGGTDTATKIAIYYDNGPGGQDNALTYSGDIGPGTSTITSIPFSVPSYSTSGILVMHINIYYSDANSQFSNSIPLTVSIPLAQHNVLSVKTLSMSGTSISPGDSFTASLEVINNGGVAKNLVIYTPDNSSFPLDGTSQQNAGDVPFNGSKIINVSMRSATSSAPGEYMVPLTIEYQDAVQNIVSQTIYVGPISVADTSAQFNFQLKPVTSTEVGSQAQFQLVVENRGSSTASAIIDLNQSAVFTPLGNSRIYLDDLGPHENYTAIITLGVDAASSAGYYTLPVVITTSGKTYTQKIGIAVQASQEITMSTTTQPSVVGQGSSGVVASAEISNTGNSPIRSVYVKALPSKNFEITGTTDKFVGTLNVDDFTTFQFTFNVPPRTAPGNYTIPISITFKDSINAEHVIEQKVDITVYTPADAARLGVSGGSASSGTFAGRSRDSGFFGISLLTPINIGIALVIAVVGFFAYKKFRGSKK